MLDESGIYSITCNANGKMYIGQARNLKDRRDAHFSLLVRNKHHCIHLQRAFNKYGEDSLSWNIVELCENSELDELEQSYLDKYFHTGVLFNTSKRVGNPMKGEKHTPEAREKISKAGIGRVKTPESRQKISATRKERGISPSPEVRARISAKLAGRKIDPEIVKKMSEKKRDPENRARQSALMKGRKHKEEARLKIVKSVRDPENRARQSALMKGRKHTEEARQKIIEYLRKPETRANLSEKSRGENSPVAKLTEKDVIEIRSQWINGNILQKELAEKYNVAPVTISHIVSKRTWKHI